MRRFSSSLLSRTLVGRRGISSGKPDAAVNVGVTTATSVYSSGGFKGDENAPILDFLGEEKALLDTVPGTVAKCSELMELLKTTKNPQERHDLLDSTSNVLCLLLDPCEFVRQVHPDDHFKYYAGEAFSRGHEFMCEVNGRRDLYDVLVDLSSPESTSQMSEESNKNIRQLRQDMEKNGIHLSDKERKEIEQLNIEREELAMRYIQAAHKGADPFGVLRALLDSRYKFARKLGFESFAEQQLRGTMLDSPQRVWHFLAGMVHKYRPECEAEMKLISEHIGEVSSRDEITDVVRTRVESSIRAGAESRETPLYFTVANCVRGIQCLCREAFGIYLEERPFTKEEFFLPQAQKFHVYDANKEFAGIIILDMFARGSKHCQAGHLTIQLGCKPANNVLNRVGLDLGPRQYPVVALTCNAGSTHKAARKADGSFDPEGTVMLPHEVTTCFHEFGHALHTIFGQTTVQNLAGTRGSIDFVESFSQLFEQFLRDGPFLRMWAKKLGTNEPIPQALVDQRNKAADMFQNLDTLDQVNMAVIDQVLHGPRPFTVYFPHGDDGRMGKRTLGDLADYGKGMYNFANLVMDISQPISISKPTTDGVLRSLSYEHIASYPAGYYGYLYSLTIAKRIWKKKFGENPLNPAAGSELVEKVMRHGAACDQTAVIENYLGDNLDDIDAWA